MNWMTLIGRLGMVTLITGLAVGLVSIIPSAQITSGSSGLQPLPPRQYNFLYLFGQLSHLTPQSGIGISVGSDSNVAVYLLGIGMDDFTNWTATWVLQQFPNTTIDDLWQTSLNITVLDAVLESHSSAILRKTELAKNISIEYYPDAPINATAIVANPSPDWVQYTFDLRVLLSIAPKTKVILLTEVLIPAGAVLAAPWVYFTRTRKPKLQ
jgi:hypothetical protein